jgi:hypothetical protein
MSETNFHVIQVTVASIASEEDVKGEFTEWLDKAFAVHGEVAVMSFKQMLNNAAQEISSVKVQQATAAYVVGDLANSLHETNETLRGLAEKIEALKGK